MRMKWRDDGWRKRFALFPFVLSDGPNKTLVWLEWFWKRDAGLYTGVILIDPHMPEEPQP